MQCKGFLFDLDGTLVDSLPVVERSWCRVGIVSPLTMMKFSQFYSRQAGHYLHSPFYAGAQRGGYPGRISRYLEQIEATDIEGIVALPGALALLNTLNEAGIPWAIVTSGSIPVAHARHRAAGLPMPEVFVTAEQVKHGKPAPDAYLLGAERLGLPAGNARWWKMRRRGSSPDWRPAVALSRSTCPPMPLAWMKPTSC
ncbi:HAD hydrolase-like protein [Klebsiella pneumoniae subsp. pneumoniae]|nr:HAD hydrolase-like protein [Klebsiella pneumoniae subsp. pneumoniae]